MKNAENYPSNKVTQKGLSPLFITIMTTFIVTFIVVCGLKMNGNFDKSPAPASKPDAELAQNSEAPVAAEPTTEGSIVQMDDGSLVVTEGRATATFAPLSAKRPQFISEQDLLARKKQQQIK